MFPETSQRPFPAARDPRPPIELAPGSEIAERWELPLDSAGALDAVGSAGSVLRVEVVEASSGELREFLDFLPTGSADEVRAGRNLRIEQPASPSSTIRPSPKSVSEPGRAL